MKNKVVVLLSLMAFLFSCSNHYGDAKSVEKDPVTKEQTIIFDKLIGLWKNEDGMSYEKWEKNEDGSYLSRGFQIKESDTVYTEQVLVHKEGGQWMSENTVIGQNNGEAIGFKITKLSVDEAHFSNPAHDFPTDIHYRLKDDNTINAYIAGPNQSGARDTIPFNFLRVAN